jgi:hypothetical protein
MVLTVLVASPPAATVGEKPAATKAEAKSIRLFIFSLSPSCESTLVLLDAARIPALTAARQRLDYTGLSGYRILNQRVLYHLWPIV